MRRWLFAITLSLFSVPTWASVSAGISEFYIPVDEDNSWIMLEALGGIDNTTNMRSRISITPWSDSMTVYYDHWEDGYDFDPNNPDATADEVCTAPTAGSIMTFESNVPRPRTPANVCTGQPSPSGCTVGSGGNTDYCYDGRDHMVVVGGGVTMLRASWPTADGVGNTGLAEEVYPVTPQLTTYVLPFGEDIYAGNTARVDYRRVFVTVQATEDNTGVQVDFNADGTFDTLDCNKDGDTTDPTDGTTCLLNRGDIYLLDQTSDGTGGPFATLNTGTVIQGTATIQLQFINGDSNAQWNSRSTSAFPRGFWDNEYYAPVDGAPGGLDTDILVYNPHATALTINWETNASSGSFSVPAGTSRFFQQMTGSYVPDNSAVYLSAANVFWGISDVDNNSTGRDWAYSLVPAFLLDSEQYLSWAPGCYYDNGTDCTTTAGNLDDNGIFITPVQDNTLVFVDRNNDGVAEDTYTLNRLQTQYVFDATDGDMTGAHIWATGKYALAYGEHMETSVIRAPSLDLGYTTLPNPGDWMDLVLTTQKTTDPVVLGVGTGEVATYTVKVNTYELPMENITVTDTLATGWGYCTGVNTPATGCAAPVITFPSGATSSDAPSVSGQVLTWGSGQFTGGQLDMSEFQELTIQYSIYTTAGHTAGTVTTSPVDVSGTRTVGSPPITQTFTASDMVFNLYSTSDVAIAKTSDVATVAYPGDTITYEVTVTNTGLTPLTNVNLLDAVPTGLAYVSGSVNYPISIADYFGSQVYNNQADNLGGATWNGNWIETGDDGSATGSDIQVIVDGTNSYVLRVRDDNNQIGRRANLSTYSQALLSFDYRRDGIGSGADEYVAVEVCQTSTNTTTCSTGWVEVARFTNGTDASYTHVSYDLNSPSILNGNANSATFALRFRTPTGAMANADTVYFDNIVIQLGSGTLASVSPPEYVSSSDSIGLRPGDLLTLTYQATVDNPLASGINEATNIASVTSTQIPLSVQASVTDPIINPSAESGLVGDRIWLDMDGDGVQDVGEPGLANVQLTLRDQYGTPIAVTDSDSNGNYLFTGVAPGNGYYVEVTGGLPSGLTQTTDSRTDNRTNSFNLAASQNHDTADLGFRAAPSTATLGDLVWIDTDADRVRDAGELGLGGVTVYLYLDNGNGSFLPSEETLVGTAVTASDGSYLFFGVAAGSGQDYFVWVDPNQSALTNYDATTDVTATYTDVTAGQTLLNADFGFQNTVASYSITDRVWLDADGDGTLDGGESGAAGVTVALLDGARNVIATVTTDASGNFNFSGVPAGNYYVQVTDTFGVLTDYYGTTARAMAGEFQILGLAANLDNSTSPSFGYNVNRSIGDTVFNDLDGDGIYDAGETPFSGVVVQLRDSTGTTVLGTTTTDSNGHYLFAGLANGTYTVYIDPSQSVLSGFNLTTADDNGGGAGHTRSVTLTGTASNLGIDYGYQAPVNRSASGTIWSDDDQDGVMDAGESMLSGVTVELLNGSTVVATTTTDSSGQYSFAGLPNGNFTIRVTDINGVLVGYIPTYEYTEGIVGPFNGEEAISTASGDVTGRHFGFYKPKPTLASVVELRAYLSDNGKVYVEWVTDSEVGSKSFDLERFDAGTQAYVRVNSEPLPSVSALTGESGGTYVYRDDIAQPGARYQYRLLEQEVWGSTRIHGPYSIQVSGRAPVAAEIPADGVFEMKASVGQPVSSDAATLAPVDVRSLAASNGLMAEFKVSADALIKVDMAALEQATGLTVDELFGGRSLQLSSSGHPVAWLPVSGGYLAYVQGIDSLYTKDNVYNLIDGRSIVAQSGSAAPASGVRQKQALMQKHFEQDTMVSLVVARDPVSDYWYWGGTLAGYAPYEKLTKSFEVDDLTSAESLALNLVGGSNDLHRVEVWVNGQLLATRSWTGMTDAVFSIPLAEGALQAGVNSIELKNTGNSGNLFYLDSFDVAYIANLLADAGKLGFTATQDAPYELAGFGSDQVYLLDITDAAKPLVLSGHEVALGTNGYHVTLQARAGHQYLAVESGAILSVMPQLAQRPVFPTEHTDYLVLTTYAFKAQAEQLVAYRAQAGLAGAVVLLEDIYRAYSYGISDPNAIRAFLADAKADVGARYVTLVGSASYDYRNLKGYGDNLVSTLMTATPHGLFACDSCLADFDGDSLADLVISRIPVATESELASYLTKLRTYETAQPLWKNVLVADRLDPAAGNFAADSEVLSSELPQTVAQHKIYVSTTSEYLAKGDDLVAQMNTGVDWMNYTGHGAENLLANNSFFNTTDAKGIASAHAPLVTALSCAVNRFENSGFRSLGEELVLNPQGAVAVWAPSGLSLNGPATSVGRLLMQQVYQQGEPMLGDALAAVSTATPEVPAYMWRIYNLLGDSALHVLGSLQLENPTELSAMAGVEQTGEGTCRLTSSSRWTTATSPVIMNCDLTVEADATLTIDPGVTVKTDSGRRIISRGVVTVEGNAQQPVRIRPLVKGNMPVISFAQEGAGTLLLRAVSINNQ